MKTKINENQVSFFDMDFVQEPDIPTAAISMFNGESNTLFPVEDWMKNLLPQGEYYILCAGHPLVLCKSEEEVEPEMKYRHFFVGNKVYAATGVGKDVYFEEE